MDEDELKLALVTSVLAGDSWYHGDLGSRRIQATEPDGVLIYGLRSHRAHFPFVRGGMVTQCGANWFEGSIGDPGSGHEYCPECLALRWRQLRSSEE